MASSRMLKDPQEVRILAISWKGSLNRGDAVVSSVWSVAPVGLTTGSDTMGQLATATLASAGTVDVVYDVTNRVTTQYGVTLEKTIQVRVQNRVG